MVPALARIDQQNQYVVFLSSPQEDGIQVEQENFVKVYLPITRYNAATKVLGEQVLIPYQAWRRQLDVVYFPGNFAALVCPAPRVLAIRSTLYYHYPREVSLSRLVYRRLMTPLCARRSVRIITVSQDIRQDLYRFLGLDGECVRVVYHGIDHETFGSRIPPGELEEKLRELRVMQPYILFVSSLWRYKRLDMLFAACQRLWGAGRLRHRLVVAGYGLHSAARYYHRLAQEMGISERVLFVGHLEHKVLRYLYQGADIFVHPSAYESFGHPILEAMLAGVPVVAARVHAVPEITAGAAWLYAPDSIEGLMEGILRLIEDRCLWAELSIKGRQRAREFSWDKAARETLQVLEEAARL